jgi:hypothetical protein
MEGSKSLFKPTAVSFGFMRYYGWKCFRFVLEVEVAIKFLVISFEFAFYCYYSIDIFTIASLDR